MKKLAFLVIALLTLNTSCGAKNQQQESTTTEQTTSKKGGTVHLTKAEFLEKVYNFEKNPTAWKFEGKRPAVVDFYATWCGPCKMVAPILEDLAKTYADKVDIYKVDVDKEPEIARAFGISSIPTMLFIPVEGDPQTAVGALPKADLQKNIESLLTPAK